MVTPENTQEISQGQLPVLTEEQTASFKYYGLDPENPAHHQLYAESGGDEAWISAQLCINDIDDQVENHEIDPFDLHAQEAYSNFRNIIAARRQALASERHIEGQGSSQPPVMPPPQP